MYYLVDNLHKVILCWSPKCGCSHIKYLYTFIQTNKKNNEIQNTSFCKLPVDIENYTTIVIIRNPYKRIVSGFLEKYMLGGEFRHLYETLPITFNDFVNNLIICNWKYIDEHHFLPQTSGDFSEQILQSKTIKFFDIENIDYSFIENTFDIKIPDDVIKHKIGHERINYIKKHEKKENYVYNLNIDEYIDYNIDIKYFYNEEIKNKIFNFYKDDFILFRDYDFDYSDFI
jgi:hypothetical protein